MSKTRLTYEVQMLSLPDHSLRDGSDAARLIPRLCHRRTTCRRGGTEPSSRGPKRHRGIDLDQLTPMAEQARAARARRSSRVADRGDFKSDQIRNVTSRITPLVPNSMTSQARPRVASTSNSSTSHDDEYRCPQGNGPQLLPPSERLDLHNTVLGLPPCPLK